MKGAKATAKLPPFRYTPLPSAADPTPRAQHRNLRAVWPSLFVISMGLMAVIPTLGLYIEVRFDLHGAELQTWTGWIYAAGPLTAALCGPVWGVLGDRIGRKAMLIRAMLAVTLATGLMPLATTPAALLLLRVLQGAFAGFVAPAMVLGTADVAPERQGHVIGRMQLALAMGLLVGPAVGAEVAFQFGRAAVFWLTSALSFLSIWPVVLVAREDRGALLRETIPAGRRPGVVRAFCHDLLGLCGNRVFLALLFCVFLLRFGQHMVEPYVALWVRHLGPLPAIAALVDDPALATERTIAAAFIVLAIAQLVFTTRWGRLADRIGPLRCMATVGLGLSGVFFVTAVIGDVTGYMVLRCLAAVLMAGSMTLAYAAAARRVQPERKSLAFTLMQSGMQLGLSLGPVTGDALAAGAGIPGLYVIGGGCLAAAGLGLIAVRVVSHREPSPRTSGSE